MVAAQNTSVMSTYARYDLSFERGDGTRLYTADGTAYLDFAAGIAVNSLGHSHPKLVQVLQDQAGKLWHTSNLYRIPEQEKLADRLVANSFADQVFFTNSGAEAMECAIKTARKYQSHNGHPERYRVITFEGAFHGRTLATIAAGGQEKHLAGFGPRVDGFDQVKLHDLKALEAAITGQTAAILVEPIQGEGGIRVVGADELKAMRALCDEHGLMLIFDEVQCGLGRTGKLFAYEGAGVTPDIMALAKALGGGFPIGACLATEKAAAGMIAGSHGSTFGGNPLACAVANGVLDVLLAPGFMDRIDDLGGYLGQHLGTLKTRHPDVIEDIRGVGLMRGLKIKQPNTEMVSALQAEHVLTVGAGDNVVRLLPPLTVTEAEIDEAIAAIDRACTVLENKDQNRDK